MICSYSERSIPLSELPEGRMGIIMVDPWASRGYWVGRKVRYLKGEHIEYQSIDKRFWFGLAKRSSPKTRECRVKLL